MAINPILASLSEQQKAAVDGNVGGRKCPGPADRQTKAIWSDRCESFLWAGRDQSRSRRLAVFVGLSSHRLPAPYLLQGLGRCRLLHAGSFYLEQLAQAALVSRPLRAGRARERSDSGSGARNLQLQAILPRVVGTAKAESFFKKNKQKQKQRFSAFIAIREAFCRKYSRHPRLLLRK